jgi:CRP-like cAMP-binding protein
LTTGKAFGDLALKNNRPRAATIKCLTDCHFATIKKEAYDALIKKIELKNEKKLVDFLEALPYFANQSRYALVKLKHLMQQKEFIKSQYIIRETEPSTKVFIVRSGEFAVFKSTQLFQGDKMAEKEENDKQYLQKILEI